MYIGCICREVAIDYGGVRREFFRLLAVKFGKELMIVDTFKFMMPDMTALQVNIPTAVHVL